MNAAVFTKHKVCSMAAFLLAAHSGMVDAQTPSNKPNVLFMIADDLRPILNCYGHSDMITPNIDRLAASGMVFNRAYCQVSVCNPSRNSFLSGLRPDTFKAYENVTNMHLRKVIPDVVTLPQLFKDNGYISLSMGKVYHTDDPQSWSEPMYGFGQPYQQWFTTESQELIEKLRSEGKNPRGPAYEAADQPDNAYPDGKTADKAIETLRRVKDQSFFLGVGFIKPHLPFTCPQKYWDLYPPETIKLPDNYNPPQDVPAAALHNWWELRSYGDMPDEGDMTTEQALNLIRGYHACVSFLDAQIGRVLDELDRLGLSDNTIVVLIGDHGWHLGENRLWTKMTNFEIGTHVPLILRVPGRTSAGQTSDALVELVDIYPTLAQIAGLTPPDRLEGISMVPLLDTPDRSWKKAAFSVYGRAAKGALYKPGRGDPLGRAMRTDRYRYVEWQKADGTLAGAELYDQKTDPLNNINLANHPEYAERVAELSQQLKAGWPAALPGVVSSDGLVLEMNAANPGSNPSVEWKPSVGTGSGTLAGAPEREKDNLADGTRYYYRFGSPKENDRVSSIGTRDSLGFLDIGNGTIEAWVRVLAPIANSKKKGIVFGNTNSEDSGIRLVLRDNGSGTGYGVTFMQRDNESRQTTPKMGFFWNAGLNDLQYSTTDWVHIVVVKHAAIYGSRFISIKSEIWINGVKVMDETRSNEASSLADLYLTPDDFNIGTARGDMSLGNTDVG
ncbi:MAG: sulfatase-like hydrolase/transferase, partial [Kiritimatiellales bacterium]